MPFDVVNCRNPAIGFEAQSASEFGNGVTLATGTGRNLSQLKVDFQSYACESGHWNTGDCVSKPGDTFNWPITANIYNPNGSGGLTTPIATVTTTQTIPYRPSANSTCPANSGPAPAGAAWFNPQAVGGGACQNSIGVVLTFNFPIGYRASRHGGLDGRVQHVELRRDPASLEGLQHGSRQQFPRPD